MKVILLQDIQGVGKKHDEKVIRDGYALNFLIPKGMAETATKKASERADLLRREVETYRKIQEDLLAKNLTSVSSVKIVLTGKANDKGHLFAGIHKEELAQALKEQVRVDVPPDFLVLPSPIKEVGEHVVEVKVKDSTAAFTVTVTAA